MPLHFHGHLPGPVAYSSDGSGCGFLIMGIAAIAFASWVWDHRWLVIAILGALVVFAAIAIITKALSR